MASTVSQSVRHPETLDRVPHFPVMNLIYEIIDSFENRGPFAVDTRQFIAPASVIFAACISENGHKHRGEAMGTPGKTQGLFFGV